MIAIKSHIRPHFSGSDEPDKKPSPRRPEPGPAPPRPKEPDRRKAPERVPEHVEPDEPWPRE